MSTLNLQGEALWLCGCSAVCFVGMFRHAHRSGPHTLICIFFTCWKSWETALPCWLCHASIILTGCKHMHDSCPLKACAPADAERRVKVLYSESHQQSIVQIWNRVCGHINLSYLWTWVNISCLILHLITLVPNGFVIILHPSFTLLVIAVSLHPSDVW